MEKITIKSLCPVFLLLLPLFALGPTSQGPVPVLYTIRPFKIVEEAYQKATALTKEQIAEDVLGHRNFQTLFPSDRGLNLGIGIQLRLLPETTDTTKLRTVAFFVCHPIEALDPNPQFQVFYGTQELFLVFNVKNTFNQSEKKVFLRIYSDNFFEWLKPLIEHPKRSQQDMASFSVRTILNKMTEFGNLILKEALNGMAIDWTSFETNGYGVLNLNPAILQELFAPREG